VLQVDILHLESEKKFFSDLLEKLLDANFPLFENILQNQFYSVEIVILITENLIKPSNLPYSWIKLQ